MLVYVLSIIIPEAFILVILGFILISQSTLMGICELFLVKNCMKLVFPKFNVSKFTLNQLFLFVNVTLISFTKLVGLELVTIRLLSSACGMFKL
jgi:hypothetical protein